MDNVRFNLQHHGMLNMKKGVFSSRSITPDLDLDLVALVS